MARKMFVPVCDICSKRHTFYHNRKYSPSS